MEMCVTIAEQQTQAAERELAAVCEAMEIEREAARNHLEGVLEDARRKAMSQKVDIEGTEDLAAIALRCIACPPGKSSFTDFVSLTVTCSHVGCM